jgi:hypothetical protein
MQINQVSQILQPNVGQTKSSTGNSNTNKDFELILQQMMQSTNNQDATSTLGLDSNTDINSANIISGLNGTNLTSSVNAADNIGVQNKPSSGLDSLALNPQKLAQMLEIMQSSSSNNVMSNFGSDDSSGDDSDSDNSSDSLAIGNTSSTNNTSDVTQLLQTILQNENTSSGGNTDSNAQMQQLLDNMKL